jgi:UDP-N-acetylmuramoylalanine--D-glutamate ligase
MKNRDLTFRKKKVLSVGLGLHGGGVATAKWLIRHGAKVTVTDLRKKELLGPSIKKLKGLPVRYVLGRHRKADFELHDVVVVGPGVPRDSKYLYAAQRKRKRVENDASIFFQHATQPILAVTGTRGKTTTTLWIAALLQKTYKDVLPSGNTPDNALLKEYTRLRGKNIPVVAELSSWQLEYLPSAKRSPHVAVITNLYPDHLNRYKGMEDYARAKANIFRFQHADDFLVLNKGNAWTKFYLKQKPKAVVFFTSVKSLGKHQQGMYVHADHFYFRFDGIEQKLFSIKRFAQKWGKHNLENLLAATLAVKLYDPSIVVTEKDALALPHPLMREEVIVDTPRLMVVNDSCATSPDGTIAAIERFSKEKGHLVLIAGGTDKDLEFVALARAIKRHIAKDSLVLLEGTATKKLSALLWKNEKLEIFPTLAACVKKAFTKAREHKGKTIILFSPGAASFEKFLHEFDRGRQFNALVARYKKIA